jgi:hypothetical protein
VFSETRQAAELLQQFSGFFTGSVFSLSGFLGLAMHHTGSCPAALFDQHSVFFPLARSIVGALRQRPGAASPESIVSGDGYSVFKVPFRMLGTNSPLTIGFAGVRLL